MRSRRLSVHFGLSSCSSFKSVGHCEQSLLRGFYNELNQFLYWLFVIKILFWSTTTYWFGILWFWNVSFRIWASSSLRTVWKEIKYFVIVDFTDWNWNIDFISVCFSNLYFIKNILNTSRDETSHLLFMAFQTSCHGMSLATSRLAICKYAHVFSIYWALHQLRQLLKHKVLRCVFTKYFFEEVLVLFNPIFRFEFCFVSFESNEIVCNFILNSLVMGRSQPTVDSYVAFHLLEQIILSLFFFVDLLALLLKS